MPASVPGLAFGLVGACDTPVWSAVEYAGREARMMSLPVFQSKDCASTTSPPTQVSKCRCGPVTRVPVWPTSPSCSEALRVSPSRTMILLRWLYVVFMPLAWETSTRLPPHTSQNTAVTVPSRAATTGVPSGAEMSVPLCSSC